MSVIYEVETRFHFKNDEQAYQKLPFLNSALDEKVKWETIHYGLEEFKKDIVIRVSHNQINEKQISSLGYKEQDWGEKINIRKEYGEEITTGIDNSQILEILGGRLSLSTPEEVEAELKKLGQQPFMSFSGVSWLGTDEKLNLDFKLMYCDDIAYPLLVEVESEAQTKADIAEGKEKLLDFIAQYDLESRLVTEEPPTLLYQQEFE